MASLGRFERPTFTFGGCHSIQAELQGRWFHFNLQAGLILSIQFNDQVFAFLSGSVDYNYLDSYAYPWQ